MSNTEVRKVFFYDKEEDSDIQEWIDNLPSRSHSEFIRKAIRTMIEIEKNTQPKSENVNELERRIALLEKEMNEIKTYITNNSKVHFSQTLDEGNSQNNRENERNYVDASHIIKNLGK